MLLEILFPGGPGNNKDPASECRAILPSVEAPSLWEIGVFLWDQETPQMSWHFHIVSAEQKAATEVPSF